MQVQMAPMCWKTRPWRKKPSLETPALWGPSFKFFCLCSLGTEQDLNSVAIFISVCAKPVVDAISSLATLL